MRLIADNQVKRFEAILLGIMNRSERLIGRKNNREPLSAFTMTEALADILAIGRNRDFQIIGGNILGLLRHLIIGTHSVTTQIQASLSCPLLQSLGQQRNRRNQKQNPGLTTFFLRKLLRKPQRRKSLAGATSHNELAPIMNLKTRERLINSSYLVRARLIGFLQCKIERNL